MPANIISVFTGKGGTGKTTFVININAHMKTKGFKLLTIDTDPQRNLYSINAPDFVHHKPSLFNIIKEEVNIKEVVQQIDSYHLIPTSDNQNDLNTSINDFTILKNSLKEIQGLCHKFCVIAERNRATTPSSNSKTQKI